jgi:O-antigen/teichoic acid export membrane protein
MANDHPLKAYFWQMAKAMFAFGCVVLYSRYLGPAGRGQLSIYLLYLQAVLMINEMFVGSAQANWFSQYGLKRFVPRIIIASLSITGLAFFLGVYLLPAHSILILKYLLFWGWVLITQNVISNFWQSQGWVIKKNQILLLFEILKALALLSLILGIGNAAYGIASLLRVLVIAGTFWSIIFLIKMYCVGAFKGPKLEDSDIKHTWGEGIWAQLGQFVLFIIYRLPLYLVAEWLGDAYAGVLSNALLVIDSLWIFANSLGGVLHARIINSANDSWNTRQLNRFVSWSFLGTAFLGIFACLIPGVFYERIFGPGFDDMATFIRWMMPGYLALGFFACMGNFLHAKNEFKHLLKNHIFGLIAMVIVILTLSWSVESIRIGHLLWVFNLGLIVVAIAHFFQLKKQGLSFAELFRNILLINRLIQRKKS